ELALGGGAFVGVSRDEQLNTRAKYDTLYAQDTITVGSLTANVGLRYDRQGGSNDPANVAASRLRPDLLPAQRYAGGGAGFEWKSITPRLGITYALGAEHKTLLRASFSQFADQLANGVVGQLNPLAAQSYAYFYYLPVSGAPQMDPARVAGSPNYFSGNVNPFTGGLLQSNAVDRNLKAPTTNELLLSVEHALLPEFVVGVNFTYRKVTDILEFERLVFDCPGTRTDCAYDANVINSVGRKHLRSDYVQFTTLNGTDPH